MPGTRSVIMAAMNYNDGAEPAGGGRVARYAWGSADYHDVLKPRLLKLADLLRSEVPTARTRVVIDTAPLLERDFGRLAGIGWFGKNTMLISRTIGSWFVLGAVLTDVELAYDKPVEQNYCGSCTRCLDACPTDAFPEPGVLDARRCISYLTIELRKEPIPVDLRNGIGEWLFGCDICQDVCPWNRFAPEDTLPEFRHLVSMNPIDCRELLTLSVEEFHARYLDRAGQGSCETPPSSLETQRIGLPNQNCSPRWTTRNLSFAKPPHGHLANSASNRVSGNPSLPLLDSAESSNPRARPRIHANTCMIAQTRATWLMSTPMWLRSQGQPVVRPGAGRKDRESSLELHSRPFAGKT